MTNNTSTPYNQEPIIKQWIDECTGKFIYPITVTDAVITKHNKTLTEVLDLIFGNLRQDKDTLTDLKVRVEDLENYKNQFIALKSAFDSIKYQVDNGTFATRTDLECLRNQLNTVLEAIRIQLQTNTNLFSQLLNYLISGQSTGNIDLANLAGYLKISDLRANVKALNLFVENVKSELTNETYLQSNGIVSLPPTVGGTLYVADTSDSGYRFHFAYNCDVNGDGFVTAADVTALYNYILHGNSNNLVHGDVNNDNTITAADVTAVYNVLLNGRQPLIHDKINNKNYVLPIGSVFINGNNVYCVTSETTTKNIGQIFDPNSLVTNVAYIPKAQLTPSTPQYSQISMDEQEKQTAKNNVWKEFSENKVINIYIVALQTKNAEQTLEDRMQVISTDINNGGSTSYVLTYDDVAINSDWKGLPQEYAQGLVYLKDFWESSKEIQYVQPLGSFVDFKRFTNNRRTNYIDISMIGSDNKFNGELTRFNIVSSPSDINSKFDGKEDYIILAEYTPTEGTSYYFFWDGANHSTPVIVSDLSGYLNKINY